MIPRDYIEHLNACGVRLDSFNPGSKEIALASVDAIVAIQKLKGSDVAILGGDVVSIACNGRMTYLFPNWSCERRGGESEGAYVLRSYDEAQNFIIAQNRSNDALFILVLST